MLIATVEDVLRAVRDDYYIRDVFECDGPDAVAAKLRLKRAGLLKQLRGCGHVLTPRGAEFIRRAEAGWPAEEVG
jgi:hypothetical protein